MTSIQRAPRAFVLAIAVLISVGTLPGCNNYLVFTTATKFAIDVSQDGNQPPKVVLGYKRAEVAVIPAEHRAATATEDTYAVLGNFCVMANPSLYDWIGSMIKKENSQDIKDSLQIRSVFATGMAARQAAETAEMQAFFARATLQRTTTGATEKHCF